MEKDNQYMKAMRRWKMKDEAGQTIVWPVKNYFVDITTGEQIEYLQVMRGEYITINHKTKIYEAILNRYIERTIECIPTDTNGQAD